MSDSRAASPRPEPTPDGATDVALLADIAERALRWMSSLGASGRTGADVYIRFDEAERLRALAASLSGAVRDEPAAGTPSETICRGAFAVIAPRGGVLVRDGRDGGELMIYGSKVEAEIIDLYQAAEPPAPSFQCAHCAYRWSRAWTKPEFTDYLSRLPTDLRDYYAVCLSGYADEPSYAGAPAPRQARFVEMMPPGHFNPSPMFGLRVAADGGETP